MKLGAVGVELRAGDDRRDRPPSAKFVLGPASDTISMSRRPLREPRRVHRHRLRPADDRHVRERAEHRQDDRAERIDVRDRVQREPARPLGGVVAEQRSRRRRG